MPRLDRNKYQSFIYTLREGYAAFKQEKEAEYKQYPDLVVMDKELAALLEKYGPDKAQFTDEEIQEIDQSFGKIQQSYQNITRHQKVMNLHARDMLEGFLAKVDPSEYEHVQSQKTVAKAPTTKGNYEMGANLYSNMAFFIQGMGMETGGAAPYRRMDKLYDVFAFPGLAESEDGYTNTFDGTTTIEHSSYLKVGEQVDSFSPAATKDLEGFEKDLREYEASLQDYLNCEDIKDYPLIEAQVKNELRILNSIFNGEPILDARFMDTPHKYVQGLLVNFGTLNTLEERETAHKGMQNSLWVDIMNQDIQTMEKTMAAMKIQNPDPKSKEQEDARKELIAAYKQKEQLLLKQAEAFKNPSDPNYQNINRLMRPGMKDELHNTLDISGSRGLANHARSTEMIETLEAGWPLQETMTCRQLIAYRNYLRDTLAREDLNLRGTQPPAFVTAMEKMEEFLSENIKGAFDSPEATASFASRFSDLRMTLKNAPCDLNRSDTVYPQVTDICFRNHGMEAAAPFQSKLEELGAEAVKTMTGDQLDNLQRKQLGDSYVTFSNISLAMDATSGRVWFGSSQFRRIADGMEKMSRDLQYLQNDKVKFNRLSEGRVHDLRERMEATKKDIDAYVERKQNKTSFTQAEAERLQHVLEARRQIEKLEKTLGMSELAAERRAEAAKKETEPSPEKTLAQMKKEAISGDNPNLTVVGHEVDKKIEDKINLVLGGVLGQPVDDDKITNMDAKFARFELRSNVNQICFNGRQVMDKISLDKELAKTDPQTRVSITPEQAKDLCLYSYLRGMCNSMHSNGTEQNIKLCNKVIGMLSRKDCQERMKAGIERSTVYQNLLKNGVNQADMRDMVNSVKNADITKSIMAGIKAHSMELKAAQTKQPVNEKQVTQPEMKNAGPEVPSENVPLAPPPMV